jgi:hypothetical protein
VSGGELLASITLLGNYATANFNVSVGSGDGTLVDDPSVVRADWSGARRR